MIESAPDAAEALVDVVRGKTDGDDAKLTGLKLKGSLWILERVLGKNDKLKPPITPDTDDDGDGDQDLSPDQEEIDSVLNAVD